MAPEQVASAETNSIGSDSRVRRALLDGVERDFALAYRVGGIHTALGTLNARTRFRFTALYQTTPGRATARIAYDREHPRAELAQSTGELAEIARVVARECAPDSAASDVSFVRGTALTACVVPSRVGAVVLSAECTPWGVLFHYDLRLRLAAPNEGAILEHLGSRLAQLCPDALRARGDVGLRR